LCSVESRASRLRNTEIGINEDGSLFLRQLVHNGAAAAGGDHVDRTEPEYHLFQEMANR